MDQEVEVDEIEFNVERVDSEGRSNKLFNLIKLIIERLRTEIFTSVALSREESLQ